jgi:TldD protein
MPEANLKGQIDELRPELGEIVTTIEGAAPYGAVLLSSIHGLEMAVDNRQETVSELDPTAGSIVTSFDGLTMRERALGGFDKDLLLHAAQELAGEGGFAKQAEIDLGPERKDDFKTMTEIDPSSISTEDKLGRLRELHHRVNKIDDRIVNVRIRYLERGEQSVFRNRLADLSQDVQRVYLIVLVIVTGEDGVRYNWKSRAGTAGWEMLTFTDEELETLVEHTIGLLSAERIEPGEYNIIAGPDIAGVVCHESFGHGVETDMFLKDRAKAAYYLDRAVGSPLVDIWDDPSFPKEYGSYYFDGEGYLAKPTQIVEKGIFKRGITDLYSATVQDIPRSPNGRRQDFGRKAYARMSNTFFGRGTTPVEELFNQVDDGIYLAKASSGMEDPKGWGIQVTSHYGHEIKHGELTGRMFAPVGITGFVPAVLNSITAVGDDLDFFAGTCGKGHKEEVPVSSGGPHMLMKARLG